MQHLVTPFGEIFVLIDGVETTYKIVKGGPDKDLCPDIVGRYHIFVNFVPDGKEHEIKCIVSQMECVERGPESGEMIECQGFYSKDGWKLSIGLECETGYLPDGRRWSDRYDYDAAYLENGMAYLILKDTKETQFKFGVAWIDNVCEEEHKRDVQTWYAADTTYPIRII